MYSSKLLLLFSTFTPEQNTQLQGKMKTLQVTVDCDAQS